MFESGFYPQGAEFDPDAPYNQFEEEVDVDVDIQVIYSRECQPDEVETLTEELRKALNKSPNVTFVGNLDAEYEDGELSVYVEPTVRIAVTTYGNFITDPEPQPSDDEIAEAEKEFCEATISVDGWTIEKL